MITLYCSIVSHYCTWDGTLVATDIDECLRGLNECTQF